VLLLRSDLSSSAEEAVTFPSFRGFPNNTDGPTATTAPVIALPTEVEAGDTLFVIFRSAGAGAITWPAGWNELVDASPDAADDQFSCAWKLALGTEAGTTITLTAPNARFAAIAWCVQDAIDPTITPPAISTVAIGTSAGQPNATTVTPTGGSRNYLYLTFFSMEGEATGITSYPTGYTLAQSGIEGSGTAGSAQTNVRMAGAGRQKGLTTAGAASEDAGPWTVAGTLDDWSAYTVAFYPQAMPAGGIQWAGIAASLLLGLSAIQIPAGEIEIKGPARDSGTIAIDLGEVAYAGLAPVVDITNVSNTIDVGVGALAYQGHVQTVRSGDLQLNLEAGSLVIKGPAHPEAIPQLLTGTLAYTGHALVALDDLPGSGLSIPPGSLVLQGQVLDRLPTQTIAVPVGALTLSGQYVSVAFKQPDCGQLVWQGYAPSTGGVQQITILIGPGEQGWQGLAPVSHLDHFISPAAGSLVYAAPLMNVTTTGNIEIPAGSIVITGTVTDLPALITVPVGSLVLTGQILSPEATREMGTGELVWTGTTPIPLIAGVPITDPDTIAFGVTIERTYHSTVRIRRAVSSEVVR
jgi:hypothetical protein